MEFDMLKKVVVLGLGFAALTYTGFALANDKVRLCTGSATGNYTFAGMELAKRYPGIEIINTNGSVDNARMLMDNKCDVAFVQSDVAELFTLENPHAVNAFHTVTSMYDEYVHVICPVQAKFSRIVDIGKHKPKVPMFGVKDGTGSGETWRALRSADDSLYSDMPREPVGGLEAIITVRDSGNTGKPACMVWVSGLNSDDMKAANRASVNTKDRKPSLMLVDVDDRDMKKIRGSNGQSMYRFEEITRVYPTSTTTGVYDNLMQSKRITVPVVEAQLIARKDFYTQLPNKGRFLTAIEDAKPTIWAKVNPSN
jgi:uncharacterized protein